MVLSGGGAKGMAHIGVLKVLERAGIPVDIVTGTSMGSIVGGLYSVGFSAKQLDSLVRCQDWPFLLSDRAVYSSEDLEGRRVQSTYFFSKTLRLHKGHLSGATGVIEGKNLMRLFRHLTTGYTDSMSFDSLPRRFACVATNIVDNTEYDFHSGVLAEAMRTSMSIPGVFTPVRKGDRVLVDGGLRNNYPADLARAMGADYVIGATVQGPPKTADDLANGSSVLGQIVDVNCKNKYDDNLKLTDIAFRVDTRGYNAASFTPNAIDTLIRRGEEEAMRHWDEIIALKHRLGMTDGEQAPRLCPHVEALRPLDFSAPEARPTDPSDELQGSLGVRFDTEEKVAMQMSGTWSSGRKPFRVGAVVRLGRNYKGSLYGGWRLPRGTELGVGYAYAYHDLDFYHQGEKSFNATFAHHQARVSMMNINVRNMTMDVCRASTAMTIIPCSSLLPMATARSRLMIISSAITPRFTTTVRMRDSSPCAVPALRRSMPISPITSRATTITKALVRSMPIGASPCPCPTNSLFSPCSTAVCSLAKTSRRSAAHSLVVLGSATILRRSSPLPVHTTSR